jgi:membrane protein implicated in regulation of membrane protease activity
MSHRNDPDFWEIIDLAGGFGIVALPLFALALPAVVLLGYLLVPLAVLGLAVAIVVVPPLAVVKAIMARRRRSRDSRAPMSRSGEVSRQTAMSTMMERPA